MLHLLQHKVWHSGAWPHMLLGEHSARGVADDGGLSCYWAHSFRWHLYAWGLGEAPGEGVFREHVCYVTEICREDPGRPCCCWWWRWWWRPSGILVGLPLLRLLSCDFLVFLVPFIVFFSVCCAFFCLFVSCLCLLFAMYGFSSVWLLFCLFLVMFYFVCLCFCLLIWFQFYYFHNLTVCYGALDFLCSWCIC